MLTKLKDPMVRKYVYSIVSALIPVLVVAGVMVPGWSEVTLTLVAALLGLGTTTLAGANTPKALEEQAELAEQESIDVASDHEPQGHSEELGGVPASR